MKNILVFTVFIFMCSISFAQSKTQEVVDICNSLPAGWPKACHKASNGKSYQQIVVPVCGAMTAGLRDQCFKVTGDTIYQENVVQYCASWGVPGWVNDCLEKLAGKIYEQEKLDDCRNTISYIAGIRCLGL